MSAMSNLFRSALCCKNHVRSKCGLFHHRPKPTLASLAKSAPGSRLQMRTAAISENLVVGPRKVLRIGAWYFDVEFKKTTKRAHPLWCEATVAHEPPVPFTEGEWRSSSGIVWELQCSFWASGDAILGLDSGSMIEQAHAGTLRCRLSQGGRQC
jgi:hypothetical protein